MKKRYIIFMVLLSLVTIVLYLSWSQQESSERLNKILTGNTLEVCEEKVGAFKINPDSITLSQVFLLKESDTERVYKVQNNENDEILYFENKKSGLVEFIKCGGAPKRRLK